MSGHVGCRAQFREARQPDAHRVHVNAIERGLYYYPHGHHILPATKRVLAPKNGRRRRRVAGNEFLS